MEFLTDAGYAEFIINIISYLNNPFMWEIHFISVYKSTLVIISNYFKSY